jgi:predicted dehydrogenase/threonine dehydrogenase-like Zn-dependent dehydrogenase
MPRHRPDPQRLPEVEACQQAAEVLEVTAELLVKQLAQYQDGRLELQDVPVPTPPTGGVLVRTTHSVISVGTEKMKVEQARMNLLQKARARPDQVRKVLDTARTLGWRSALQKVRNRLETPTPLGYSAAGIVTAVDPANTRFRVGDRVCCGGAECAFHAEYVAVPDLLVAAIPDGVETWRAAYVTIAAIALQAVRQASPQLGERVLVMGQGLVGLLVTNLLAAAGARVMAVDLQETRRPFAIAMGAEHAVIPGPQNLAQEVRLWTGGQGVDLAVLCTAGANNSPTEQAAAALRDRGRLIVVGNTRADLDWKVFYEKELEVRYSRSYGPGRYDPAFEWGGADYPLGYVRWTETRNFDACLHLLRTGSLRVDAITTRRVRFDQSLAVYGALVSGQSSDLGVVLEYPAPSSVPIEPEPDVRLKVAPEPATVTARTRRLAAAVKSVDVIGAGNFARTMLLPHLKGRIGMGTVVNQTALSANHVRAKFGFARAATDTSGLWNNPDTDAKSAGALLIATRHHLHAGLVKAGLEAGRHLFVEKPLCLSRKELAEIDAAFETSSGSVLVGFNRRFAPASVELRRVLASIPGPRVMSYRVNAGPLDPQHWYANISESGGRVVGEACHFLDFFCSLVDAPPVRVSAQCIGAPGGRLPFPDSVSAQIEFADGSSAQLIYTAEGDPGYPKECFSLYAAGLVAEIVDFQRFTLHRDRRRVRHTHASKGHAEEMAAWLAFLRAQADHPLPYAVARQSMCLTFAVIESIQQARSVPVHLDRDEVPVPQLALPLDRT